jgi:5-(carboxyamino)imidazole ribonucleotide mutase
MAQVGIIMGSASDLPVMQKAIDILKELGIDYEVDIVSAHRTPKKMMTYGQEVAAISPLPVIGVPVKSSNSIDGWDSVLSILQMPGGVPVATVALNGAENAGILAAQIIGSSDQEVLDRIIAYKEGLKAKVIDSSKKLNA